MRETWISYPLGDLCDFRAGLWKSDKSPLRRVGVVRNTNFTRSGRLDFSDVAFLDVEERSFLKRRLFPGDIILEKSGGGPKQPVGRVCLFEEANGEFSFSNFTAALTVKDRRRLDPEFLLLFLMWCYESGVTEAMQSHSTGIRNLDGSAYKKIAVPIPPLLEQQRIVATLKEAFEGLDAAVDMAQTTFDNIRRLEAAVLDEAIQYAAKSASPVLLNDVCERITVGHVGPMATRYSADGIPFLRSQNVRPFYLDLSDVKFIDEGFDAELAKSRLRPGDVAIVRTGYPGTACVIPADLPTSNCADLVIATPSPMLVSEFLAIFLNSPTGRSLVGGNLTGAAQKHFNVGAAKRASIPLPTLDEQRRLAMVAREGLEASAQLRQIHQRKLSSISELKQSLFARAFAGELTREPLAA